MIGSEIWVQGFVVRVLNHAEAVKRSVLIMDLSIGNEQCQVVPPGLLLRNEQITQNWSGRWESDWLIKTKYCEHLGGFVHNAISAQCSECQSDEIQTSAGKRRE